MKILQDVQKIFIINKKGEQLMTVSRFWVKYNLKKDGSSLWEGFNTINEATKKIKELRSLGYNPIFDRKMERRACIEIAIEYMDKTKSFRNFENEQNIPATESPIIWSEVAKIFDKILYKRYQSYYNKPINNKKGEIQ